MITSVRVVTGTLVTSLRKRFHCHSATSWTNLTRVPRVNLNEQLTSSFSFVSYLIVLASSSGIRYAPRQSLGEMAESERKCLLSFARW